MASRYSHTITRMEDTEMMKEQCEYCGRCGIVTKATLRVTYMQSEVYHGIDPDDDKRITETLCRSCADNGCPSTATRETL